MHNLVRRQSGIYALRLAVPKDLRGCLSKTEIIESTGTRETALAKIVAGASGARWRERFIELRRLKVAVSLDAMTPDEILRLTSGSPALHGASHLPLQAAASASGIAEEHLLRLAAERRLNLWCRVGRTPGLLLREEALELVEPAMGPAGGFVMPSPSRAPAGALTHVADGTLRIDPIDAASVAAGLSRGTSVDCVAFRAPGYDGTNSDFWFVPDAAVEVTRAVLELSTAEVERTRRELARFVAPEQLEHARAIEKRALATPEPKNGRHGNKLLSEALDHYEKHGLPHKHQNAGEIARIKNGCALLPELHGDVPIGTVTTEQLRTFRDTLLAKVPERENKVRLIHKTKSVAESDCRGSRN